MGASSSGSNGRGCFGNFVVLFLFIIFVCGFFFRSCDLFLQEDEVRLPVSSNNLEDANSKEVASEFRKAGFTKVSMDIEDTFDESKDGKILTIKVDGEKTFNKGSVVKRDVPVAITTYNLVENAVVVPLSARKFRNTDFQESLEKLQDAGFTNITTNYYESLWSREGTIKCVSIDGEEHFFTNAKFRSDDPVVITVYKKPESSPSPTPDPTSTPAPAPTPSPTPEPSNTEDEISNNDNTGGGGNSNFNTYDNPDQQQTSQTYVLNTSSMKFHRPRCRVVKKIAPQNYSTSNLTRDELIAIGYDSCGICSP